MLGDGFIIFVVPAVVFCATLFLTYFLGKNSSRPGLVATGLLWAGFTVAMFFGLEQSTGWDGLGFLAGLIGISAPVGVGYLLGGSAGWLKSEKAIDA